jgi:putative membrane-bound dehydrogenase-like protein
MACKIPSWCRFVFVSCLLGLAPARAQQGFPVATSPGLAPEAAAKAMTLPAGFRSTLFAGEPDVHQPAAFTIDERGRLWVVENYSYPDWSPYGRDRILILEDTDGDGHFDKSTVFFDQLNFATAIAVGHGGVWVGSAPYLLFIPDKNRDDVPDGLPQVVLDGWGHDDLHETLNSFVWGPDGWLYGNNGIYSPGNVGKPGALDSERIQLNACIWRYHPTKKTFEVFANGMSNQWGLDFNDVGDAFVTACVIPHLWHVIQGGYYKRQSGQHYHPYVYADIQTIADHAHWAGGKSSTGARMGGTEQDAAGGGHAHAGTMIYLGDSFPAEYRGSLLTNNILGNRINRDLLEAKGSGYVGHHGGDFMRANDGWFRGLRLELGPDGSVFDSDWYDARACHQQQPHDRTNGRIYKLSYGPAPTQPVASPNLAKLSSAELVQLQLHANEWYVRRARLLLQERGPDAAVHAALSKIIRENPDVTRQLRALWALHVTRGLTEALALELLKSPAPYVRGWTIQLLCEDRRPSAAVLEAMAGLAKADASPVVRRFLASAAQRVVVAKRWGLVEALLAHGEDSGDHNLPLLYWFAAEPLVPADSARAAELAKQTPLTALKPFFTKRAAALADDASKGGAKGAAEKNGLDTFAAAIAESEDIAFQREMVDSLTTATDGKTTVKPPAGWSAAYAKLNLSGDPALIARADALATRFGDKNVFAAKRRIAADPFAPVAARQAALTVMIERNDFQLAPLYHSLLTEPGLRLGALRGLSAYDVPSTPAAILAAYAGFDAEEKRLAVSVLAARPAYARDLLAAMKVGTVTRGDVDASVVRQIRLFKETELDRELTAVWGVSRDSAENVAADIAKWKSVLTPARLVAANPSRGRMLFQQTCATCHVLYDEGRRVGPELTGSNRADLDYILRNVLDPNAEIGRDYQLTTIETRDGRTAAGIVQKETPAAVTLANQAETVTLARENIKKMKKLEVSLMPPGLLTGRSENEVADLFAYLRTTEQVK